MWKIDEKDEEQDEEQDERQKLDLRRKLNLTPAGYITILIIKPFDSVEPCQREYGLRTFELHLRDALAFQ